MDLAASLNATLRGSSDSPTLVFLHGFGCGQAMWRHVAPAFEDDHHLVLFDLPGSAGADPDVFDPQQHTSLSAYAEDVLTVLDELGLQDVTIVGHSVGSMIGVLAHVAAPSVITRLVLVSPSSRYLDDGDYRGGFSASDIDDLLDLMARNHLGWQEPLSAMVAGGSDQADREELEDSFCRTRPEFAAQFAEVTFRSDNRADLAAVTAPTLILQVREDVIAPVTAGQYIRDHVAGSELSMIETRGHAPHLSAPDEVITAMRDFLGAPVRV